MKQDRDTLQKKANELLKEVIIQGRDIGIPISDNVESQVEINTRAKNRLGACKQTKKGHFTVEIVSALNICNEKKIKEVIAHELLHTCYACQNHGKKWKKYAEDMNRAYGYNIRRTYSIKEFADTFGERKYNYRIVCDLCNAETYRYRKSNIVKYTNKYRCNKCGGKFTVQKLTGGNQ